LDPVEFSKRFTRMLLEEGYVREIPKKVLHELIIRKFHVSLTTAYKYRQMAEILGLIEPVNRFIYRINVREVG